MLLRGGKLAGILIETLPAGPGRIGVVIGIGVNLRRAADVAARIDNAAPSDDGTTSSAAVPVTPPAALESVLVD
ncbi:MAG: hypothetical protein J0H91_00075, partial [Rhodospirillales bacterium]|nr:hypothetical protein [Rhodospirillales bacterium]